MRNLIYLSSLAAAPLLIMLFLTTRRASGVWWDSFQHKQKLAWTFAIAAILYGLVILKVSSPDAFGWDFINAYYPAGLAALRQDQFTLRSMLEKGVQGGFVNLPSVALALAPLGLLPAAAANVLVSIVGLASIVFSWATLSRIARLDAQQRFFLALMFLLNGPLLNGFKYGNLSYFVLACLTGSLAQFLGRRPLSAGAILGLGAVLKPALALFGVMLILQREWRGLAGFAATGLFAATVSLVVYGWDLNLLWLDSCILKYSHNWLGYASVQSFQAFQLRANGADPAFWGTYTPSFAQGLISSCFDIGVASLIALAFWIKPTRAQDQQQAVPISRVELEFLLFLSAALILSPLTWAHYYAWLLVPTAYLVGLHRDGRRQGWSPKLGWIAVAINSPLVIWPLPAKHTGASAVIHSVLSSNYFLAGTIWMVIAAAWLISGVPAKEDRSLPSA